VDKVSQRHPQCSHEMLRLVGNLGVLISLAATEQCCCLEKFWLCDGRWFNPKEQSETNVLAEHIVGTLHGRSHRYVWVCDMWHRSDSALCGEESDVSDQGGT
jgi:hypothetical protein